MPTNELTQEMETWLFSDLVPHLGCLHSLGSLCSLKGELCPLVYLREPLKLCKDSNGSEEGGDSHGRGWERLKSSDCVP